MTDPFRRKILNLATIALLLLVWGAVRLILSVRFAISNQHLSLLIDIPPWLGIGALMRNAIHPHTRGKLQGRKEFFAALILGWVLMGLFWFLPGVFPSLRSSVHGLGINLLKSPLVSLIGMAFCLGFFMQAGVKLFPYARKGTKASLVEFFRGDSGNSFQNFLEGIKKILFVFIPA